MKPILLFTLMLAVFAVGVYVLGFSEGSTGLVEVAVVTAAFGVGQFGKRMHRTKRGGGRGSLESP